MIINVNQYKLVKESIDNLSDDIIMLKADTLEPIDANEWVIDTIIDIIQDPKDIEKYEKSLKENNLITTDLTYKGTGVNDIIWITAMLKPRTKSTAYPMGELGVLQCRVIRTYYGTTKLNQLKRAGKI